MPCHFSTEMPYCIINVVRINSANYFFIFVGREVRVHAGLNENHNSRSSPRKLRLLSATHNSGRIKAL